MTGTQKEELDALLRMQVFCVRNADALGTVAQSPSRTALDDAISALQGKAADQSATLMFATSQTKARDAAREDLRLHHMQPIAAIARAKLAGTPQIIDLRLPRKSVDDPTLVAAGMAMVGAAGLYTQVFIDQKMPADFLAQLQAAVDAVKGAIAARTDARQRFTQATRGVDEQVLNARSTARILNGLVVKQLKGQADLLATWKAAKRINAKPGVPQGTTKAPAPGTPAPPVAPGTPITPAPAASPEATTSPSAPAGAPAEPKAA